MPVFLYRRGRRRSAASVLSESAQPYGYLCDIMPHDMSPRLTREDRFCLLLSREQLTPEEQTRAGEFLSTPVQWSLLLDRAYAHQVYPLVYRNLRQLGFPAVPEVVQTSSKPLIWRTRSATSFSPRNSPASCTC